MRNSLICLGVLLFLFSCGDNEKKEERSRLKKPASKVVQKKIERPDFNQDSAYTFIQRQVEFGPRVPNTKEHVQCAAYLQNTLERFGLNVLVQRGKVKAYNGKELNIFNIIGEYLPEAKKRILLFAHWDTRPFADQDNRDRAQPILGANDGASGVGVLLEVARQLTIQKPDVGVDILFFDAEDYGQPASDMVGSNTDSWCLGSQYWARNMHREGYSAEFGILLDMVGSADAYFTEEVVSMQYAPDVVRKVWKVGQSLGYGHMFASTSTGFYVTDDHKYVNTIAKIPSIDIIHYDRGTRSFHPSWHTHQDKLDVIDKKTIGAVGETLLAVIQKEQ